MKKTLVLALSLSSMMLALPIHAASAHHGEKPKAKAASAEAPAQAKEKKVESHGSVTVDGQRILYTATAGTIILHNEKGKPEASMFYIAYAKDNADASKRPVTFAYNGGPGGSSVLVDIGGFGPRRVETANAKPTPPAPYKLESNPYSLLDKTDLVFIDAVGTGLSKLLGNAKGKEFWGADQDVASFGQFIQNYLTENNRWNSPKFLLGESYGTPRSDMLAAWLQNNGIALNGVILLSSALNMNVRFSFQPPGSNDLSYELYLPSYAAIAWYHDKLPNKPTDLSAFVNQVRKYALGDYATALRAGDKIGAGELDSVAAKLHSFIGLSETYLKESNLRVTPRRFMKELLRGERRTMGRYDARFVGIDPDAAGEFPGYDASATAMFPAVVSTFHSYLNNDLKFPGAAQYTFLSFKVNHAWDWHHEVGHRNYPVPDTLPDLRRTMSENPHLKVFSGNGYFDLATPFFATEYGLNHMELDPSLEKNITFAYYHTGHMIYIRTSALAKLHKDLDAFYDSATAH